MPSTREESNTNLSLSGELERTAKKQAKAGGFASVGDYITNLLKNDRPIGWKDQLADRFPGLKWPGVERRLREGAGRHRERDRALTEEWFRLDEEANDKARRP